VTVTSSHNGHDQAIGLAAALQMRVLYTMMLEKGFQALRLKCPEPTRQRDRERVSSP